MKKTLLLTIALFLSIAAFAQSRGIILNETFDSASLPEGWTTSEGAEENWIISQTNNAGGSANELQLSWWPVIYGSSRMMTAPVNLSGINEVVVSFSHYLDNQVNEYTLSIATSTDGNDWNTAWSQTYGETGLYEVEQLISTPDMGNENVYFSIFYEGSSFTMNGWYFDNFQISTQDNLDIELLSVDMTEMLNYGFHDVRFTVQNTGSTTIESVEATFKDFFNNGNIVTETFEVNIESLEKQELTFTEKAYLAPGTYVMPIEIVSVNGTDDSNDGNNFIEKEINVGMGLTQKIPMIESFSSSTCGYCVEANIMMNEVLEANPGRYTYTKYPVNFPGTGDPYYFNEVAGRAGYYQVSAAPEFYLDGSLQEYNIVTQEALDESYNTPSFVNIRGTFNVDDNTINITADFMSYIKMENVRAFVSVNEKTTTENASSNGETEFHHIMMKMLDSPTGNVVNINAGEYQRLEFTHDMSSTNVEEMNDLEVALWLQNYETGEIYNSHFAYEYTDHCYPVQNLRSAIVGDCITLHIDWDAPEEGTPVGYNIYVNGELIEENFTGNSYTDVTIAGDLYDDKHVHIAEVVAVYENGMTSVAAIAIIDNDWTNVAETEDVNVMIYPNPAKDVVRLSTDNGQQTTVRVYNVMGILVGTRLATSETDEIEINVSDYNPGVYFFNIQSEEFNVTKKIIVE
ncbi:MAG: T9SS type A sorting domain-containing protein [Lentimicrobiaceae bacterium]|nr:T9SS type A sorting domain-containing protein [Lentimicrobiaceae bacterium]